MKSLDKARKAHAENQQISRIFGGEIPWGCLTVAGGLIACGGLLLIHLLGNMGIETTRQYNAPISPLPQAPENLLQVTIEP